MINNIKTLLNIEVKLEEMKLENGTVVMADSFEKGKEIFIKTDDEKVAMPVGEYLLDDDVELSKNIKEELSAPAAEPIKHSPESESAQVEQKVFAQSKVRTTLDRVLNKLNK